MIFDISDEEFKNILNDPKLYLPIRWIGNDFSGTLKILLNYFENKIDTIPNGHAFLTISPKFEATKKEIHKICGLLIRTIDSYLNGFPSKAYETFRSVMEILVRVPLDLYLKNANSEEDKLELFRAVSVEDNCPYERERIFHTPYELISKVTTTRYSIAGFPSLYLGTSLELCCEEIHRNPYSHFTLASKFKLDDTVEYTNTHIKIIEMGIKPQDFDPMYYEGQSLSRNRGRRISQNILNDQKVRCAYLYWYPLIAACSYIRVNKKDPFAPEYIIPQLLMQWARDEIRVQAKDGCDQVVGIRYFSCASVKSSDMGFNYVFPTSGLKIKKNPNSYSYCSVLTKIFLSTYPVYIHEFGDTYTCEHYLENSHDYDYVVK